MGLARIYRSYLIVGARAGGYKEPRKIKQKIVVTHNQVTRTYHLKSIKAALHAQSAHANGAHASKQPSQNTKLNQLHA